MERSSFIHTTTTYYLMLVGDHGFANKGRKWKEKFVFSRDLLIDAHLLCSNCLFCHQCFNFKWWKCFSPVDVFKSLWLLSPQKETLGALTALQSWHHLQLIELMLCNNQWHHFPFRHSAQFFHYLHHTSVWVKYWFHSYLYNVNINWRPLLLLVPKSKY